jgi:Inorganic H+ pyrophosphatase
VLAGSLAVGATLSLVMANAGGAWDNAKKFIEKGGQRDLQRPPQELSTTTQQRPRKIGSWVLCKPARIRARDLPD